MGDKAAPPQSTTTTYVSYLMPGVFLSEEDVRKVSTRNPERDLEAAPTNSFAFFYYDVVTTIVDADGENVETTSGRRNISGRHYIDAKELDLDAVKALPGNHDALIANMEGNGWDPVLLCRTGNYQPLQDDDVLLTTG